LFPLAIIYGLVVSIRNLLFDQGLISTTSFKIPVISVGNLAVGGTGKTPHTEFIIRILQNEFKVAMLSRGYKRNSKGFLLADKSSTSRLIGDEPTQIHKKFPDIAVAVDEKRVHGVKKLMELIPDLQLVVLDDAFQHRYIDAGLSILLTDYSNIYTRDFMMPAGRLREWKSGSKRADIIVVTKCPADIQPIEMRIIETELSPENNQLLFFSTLVYDEFIPVFPDSATDVWTDKKLKEKKPDTLLVSGIVNPGPIVNQLMNYSNTIRTQFFEDHYAFQAKDYNSINYQFEMLNSEEKLLVLTEKDAARVVSDINFPENLKSYTYALPIRVKILQNQEKLFIQKIKNYVVENSRNC